jgi:hypothetical protein
MWRKISIAAATIVVLTCPLAAQNQPAPRYRYWEVSPMFGYRTNITFTTDPVVEGVKQKITFEEGGAYGLSFAGRVNDEDIVEFRWTRQDTHVRFNPAVTPESRISIDQFHLDLSHEYEIHEWLQARPYIMGSFGLTRISGNGTFPSFNRFSFGLGGGIKVFPSEMVGFKVQAQWLPIVFNPEVTANCITGCVIRFGGKLGSQGELIAGPVFRF